jgi:hypothetical protein
VRGSAIAIKVGGAVELLQRGYEYAVEILRYTVMARFLRGGGHRAGEGLSCLCERVGRKPTVIGVTHGLKRLFIENLNLVRYYLVKAVAAVG